MPDATGRTSLNQPSSREFYGGLAILTIIAGVIVTRQGEPNSSFAVSPVRDPLAEMTAANNPPTDQQPQPLTLIQPAMLDAGNTGH